MQTRQIIAGCLLLGLVASAQTLPKLSLTLLSNQTAVIYWPYTNSSFTLEEATNLTGAMWRTSPLAPGFDSNPASFSTWVSATNPTTFFRLASPEDLRGIYIYSSDVSSISTSYGRTVSN